MSALPATPTSHSRISHSRISHSPPDTSLNPELFAWDRVQTLIENDTTTPSNVLVTPAPTPPAKRPLARSSTQPTQEISCSYSAPYELANFLKTSTMEPVYHNDDTLYIDLKGAIDPHASYDRVRRFFEDNKAKFKVHRIELYYGRFGAAKTSRPYISMAVTGNNPAHEAMSSHGTQVVDLLWDNDFYWPAWKSRRSARQPGAGKETLYTTREAAISTAYPPPPHPACKWEVLNPDEAIQIVGREPNPPPVVYEVANSETTKHVYEKSVKYLLGTHGLVRYVIIINLVSKEQARCAALVKAKEEEKTKGRSARKVARQAARVAKQLNRKRKAEAFEQRSQGPKESAQEWAIVARTSARIAQASDTRAHKRRQPNFEVVIPVNPPRDDHLRPHPYVPRPAIKLAKCEKIEPLPAHLENVAHQYDHAVVSVYTTELRRQEDGGMAREMITLVDAKRFWPEVPPPHEGYTLKWSQMEDDHCPAEWLRKGVTIPFATLHSKIRLFFKDTNDKQKISNIKPRRDPPGTRVVCPPLPYSSSEPTSSESDSEVNSDVDRPYPTPVYVSDADSSSGEEPEAAGPPVNDEEQDALLYA